MKKIIIFIGAFLFSTLFYGKTIGLNLLLFSLLTIVVLLINNKDDFKNRKTIIYSGLYVITGIAVFFHDSSLAIIANCVSFFTLIGLLSENKSSIYINWLNGLYTTIAGLFHRNFSINKQQKVVKEKSTTDYFHLIKIIVIPLVIFIIFIGLYKNGNPVFNDLISKIDFSFINIQWVLFAGLGYYLFSNIHKPIEVEPATELDLQTGNILNKSETFSIPKLKQENQLGIILIAMLNLLIVLFLITDVSFLTSTVDLRASIFSAQVHNGINALIASIVIAIIILLYVFRGDLNFYKANSTLKKLAITWIILNLLLVLSIAAKNSQYIYYFGLTYKRIGVHIYLILSIVGLITTLLKISNIKNIWYLLRVNTQTAFAILIISSTINWDNHITNYNLNYAQSMDFKYLIELSNNNTILLKEQMKSKPLDDDTTRLVIKKYRKYITELRANDWQELQYDNFKLGSK
ncbi:DUF4153 domain-containing protein [Winogradskyella sp. UBA3174]|uniref:DUF4153 domain-containing protein n=1 Tax=Winogradskyella sp. UBA3174 TaxID=1947785 RepID=UPI0025D04812|nr:DUF4173 domain-containing protein [Winogradskyella sp. UBA3174]|tara:strand:+ start:52479 stop:53864 length:1386 start_codon:yes stop_codon:yes gene_type:complete